MTYSFLYLPYLPVEDRFEIGGWEVVPTAHLAEYDVAAPVALTLARGLVSLHERPPSSSTQGAFARPRAGKVGDEFGLGDFGRLRRAVVVTLLDRNASGVSPDGERDLNKAWRTYTSEHAQAWGHRIDEEGWVAEERGGMVRILAGGYNVLHEDSIRFAHPIDLHSPRIARQLDAEYGSALYRLLGEDTAKARRLGRSIDWLELVWRNADALDLNLRIAALHSGFETLLDKPADTTAAARALSHLLDPADVETRPRPLWTTRRGRPIENAVSDLAWWYVQFAQLRNAILHGDPITSEHHHDDLGRAHLWVAEETFRRAIRETVAAAGWPELRSEITTRALGRAMRRAEQAASGDAPD